MLLLSAPDKLVLCPGAAAMCPSRLIAYVSVTHGLFLCFFFPLFGGGGKNGSRNSTTSVLGLGIGGRGRKDSGGGGVGVEGHCGWLGDWLEVELML